jgi:ubiquinone/menaquinone biosynthesis C-methylase UbiE
MRAFNDANGYEIPDWVEWYAQRHALFLPEQIVLDKLKDRLPTMKMLDIGIGGGRTTCHFAELVQEYVGLDFDKRMLQACKQRFPNTSEKIFFHYGDVRSMNFFQDQYFDFILFSFNGIDYLSHEDRMIALKEIKRVGKKESYFLFSTHNLNCIDTLFTIRLSKDPFILSRELYKNFILRIVNGRVSKMKAQTYTMIYDGIYRKKLTWLFLSIWKHMGYFYYSKPEEQIRQLEEVGFKVANIYTQSGEEITDRAQLETITDYWIHYLCENSG